MNNLKCIRNLKTLESTPLTKIKPYQCLSSIYFKDVLIIYHLWSDNKEPKGICKA